MIEPDPFLRTLFGAAVAVADPMRVIPAHLPEKPEGRVVVVGAGKASARMAEAVESVWGPCEGLVITHYGYARPTKGIRIVEAAHPVPDELGLMATERMLSLLESLQERDFVLALMSGGASALLSAPADGLSLSDKQAVHQALLSSGAPIGVMNMIRKHLSRAKGGQLAAAAYPARVLSLAISDVSGDNPAEIGSGATAAEVSTNAQVRELVERYEINLTGAARACLEQDRATVVSPNDPRLSTTRNTIIAAPSQSLAAAIELNGQAGIWGIACDTDGVDDAADVAGAVFTPDTLDRAEAQGVDPAHALRRNDSHRFFEAIAAQVVPGPTLTNVNDFRAILIQNNKETQ